MAQNFLYILYIGQGIPMASTNTGENVSLNSSEYLVFRKNYRAVIDTVKADPDGFCDALFEQGYISTEVRNFTRDLKIKELVKARKLVDTVLDRIEQDPKVFHGFLEVLINSRHEDLLRLLQNSYKMNDSAGKTLNSTFY